MQIVIFTHFRQKRKTFYKHNVLGTLFDQNRQNEIFKFWEQKSENVLIFRFWSAFGAQNAPEPKSWRKSKKKRLWAFWVPKTCPEPYVYHCFALGAKMMHFHLFSIFVFLRFSDAKCVFGRQNHQKR